MTYGWMNTFAPAPILFSPVVTGESLGSRVDSKADKACWGILLNSNETFDAVARYLSDRDIHDHRGNSFAQKIATLVGEFQT